MPLLSLNLQRHAPAPGNGATEFTFHSAEVSRRLFPGWGLFYSALLHAALVSGIVSWTTLFPRRVELAPKHWELTMLSKDVLYLPQLGGGSPGGGGGGAHKQTTSDVRQGSLAAESKPGVTYPGRQAIVSNPPNPTNHVQTVLQPELLDPLPVQAFLSLPNIVKLARVAAPPAAETSPIPTLVPQPSPAAVEAEPQRATAEPLLPPVVERVFSWPEPPKLTLPLGDSDAVPAVLRSAASSPAPPAEPPAQSRPAITSLSGGRNVRSLLALSVSPSASSDAPKVPPGETRGQFAIATLPNLGLSGLGPGSQVASSSTGLIGVGDHPDPSGRDVTGASSGAPTGKDSGGGSGVAGAGGGSGNGRGPGSAEAGIGSGPKAGAGAGGPGTGAGSGTGAGAGPGPGEFAGMTIQGGEWAPGSFSGNRFKGVAGSEDQGSYGITIVSSGNSGGGLGDFGVFGDEPVFTVYINMAKSLDDPAPSWTLQYALATASGTGSATLSAPFPARKEEPGWPQELALKYTGQTVVASAVIDAEGGIQGLRIIQSPNSTLDPFLIAALKEWVFRPAQSGGQAVAVKVLLGAPVAASR
jgi:Gram-negative bacterial TonB protein C-terminal